MKKVLVLTAIIFTVIFSSQYSMSQCPTPLSWDYPNFPFDGEIERSIPLSTNPLCVLTYKYCWRETPEYYDFAITEVSLEGDCDQFKNLDTLIKYAARDLVTNVNPWESVIPECPQLSSKYWRQSTAACFTDFYWDPVSLQWVSTSCDTDGQERWCWTSYQYCWYYENNERFLRETIINRSAGGPPCPPQTTWGMNCNGRCQ